MIESFLNLTGLSTFLEYLKELFATKDLATITKPGLMSADDKDAFDLLIKNKELDGGYANTSDSDFFNEYDGGKAT